MNTDRKYWLVGNSQLITSIIPAYCSAEELEQCSDDWSNARVTQGRLSAEGTTFQYLACNMGVLGDPAFEEDKITYSDNLKHFINATDADAEAIFIMLRGNEFAIQSLADTNPRWDFSYESQLAVPGRQFIRQKDIFTHFWRVTTPLLATCLLYRYAFPKARVFHVAAPPPIESEEHILNNPEIFGSILKTYGIRPFALRQKIYAAMYEPLAKEMNVHGIKTLFSPDECLTQSGGLLKEYAHGCLHGNKKYGEALMKIFLKELESAPL
ncbi:MAG: hypothetical protein LDL29_03380 [Dechloromonas sp.]|uniref:hypothetical protein n=1 Tax=Azonexus hydrophilus TaxID=418702 RepID=UPI0024901757|nr:hypothetical protein [Azonexus hydrophilus]MCA1937693.1 hypothetical protein [Dechloromonas sp.]